MKGLLLACGHAGARLADVQRDLDRYRADPRVKVIVTTEHYNGKWRPAYKADGWKWAKQGEHVCMWRTAEFTMPALSRLRVLTSRVWFATTGRARPGVKLAVFPLKGKRGRLHKIAVSHFPPHIELRGRLRDDMPARTKSTKEALAALSWRTRMWARRHPRSVRVVAADWNLNHHSLQVRLMISDQLHGLDCPRLPDEGDLGRRLISVPWTSVEGCRLVLLPKGKSSDHRAVLCI